MTQSPTRVEYLVIGHVTKDVTPQGYRPGGTVTYSGRLAQALGYETAILTSASPDYDLSTLYPGMQVCSIPSEQDTIFDNIYQENSRIQILHGRAAEIDAAAVPPEWHAADIVHLGPLTNEIDPRIVEHFPNSMIGITPQGWMRRWDEDGRVYAQRFEAAEWLFGQAAAVVISEEDLLDDAMLDDFIAWSNVLVMTENYLGCTVFFDGESHRIPAPAIDLVEPTGAGDIFAAAFFVCLHRSGGDPLEAARFANHVAAHSVTQRTLEEKVMAWKAAPTED